MGNTLPWPLPPPNATHRSHLGQLGLDGRLWLWLSLPGLAPTRLLASARGCSLVLFPPQQRNVGLLVGLLCARLLRRRRLQYAGGRGRGAGTAERGRVTGRGGPVQGLWRDQQHGCVDRQPCMENSLAAGRTCVGFTKSASPSSSLLSSSSNTCLVPVAKGASVRGLTTEPWSHGRRRHPRERRRAEAQLSPTQ